MLAVKSSQIPGFASTAILETCMRPLFAILASPDTKPHRVDYLGQEDKAWK